MKLTYNIKLSLVVALLAIGIAGCRKDLEQLPETQLIDGGYWKTPSDLALGCNYLYTFLPGFAGDPTNNPTTYSDNYSDDAYGSGSNTIGNGSRNAPATSPEWTNFYKLIRAANNIIEKSANISGDAALINKYVGEARFFRAYAYFELVKRFGDVPYVDKTLKSGDPELYSARTPRQQIIDKIFADLDFAATSCPQADIQQNANEYGRINRAAALAFKSRVGLFEGTWDKYRNLPTATANLKVAVDASKLVMDEAKHSLYKAQGAESYYYEFQYNNGLNGNPIQTKAGPQVNYTYTSNQENILVRLYGTNPSNVVSSHSYMRGNLEQGGIAPTRNLADAYLNRDGTVSNGTGGTTSSLDEFQNRDPRMEQTIWNKTMKYPSIGGLINYIPGTNYRIRKYFTVGDWFPQQSFLNYNVIRYAEVLLNYAEATYELNSSISDDDLNKTINELRNRATANNPSLLPLLTNVTVPTGSTMLNEIRRERRVELAFEGFRYWDLLRWKTAETVLPQAVLGRKYFAAEDPASAKPPIQINGFVRLEPASTRVFNPSKHYLWPLPTNELALNKNLTQNPNW